MDVCAGAVIISEAGGVVHHVDNPNKPLDLVSRGMCCAATRQLSEVGADLAAKYRYYDAIMQP